MDKITGFTMRMYAMAMKVVIPAMTSVLESGFSEPNLYTPLRIVGWRYIGSSAWLITVYWHTLVIPGDSIVIITKNTGQPPNPWERDGHYKTGLAPLTSVLGGVIKIDTVIPYAPGNGPVP